MAGFAFVSLFPPFSKEQGVEYVPPYSLTRNGSPGPVVFSVNEGLGMRPTEEWRTGPIAVLLSGGPDSAILLGELASTSPRVVPIYVRFGLFWEDREEQAVRRFVISLNSSTVSPLQVFDLPLHNVYGTHWSNTGINVPDENSSDFAVMLPGRNLLVVVQAAVWCSLNAIPTLALGLLKGNPFPDSTDTFMAQYEKALNLGLEGNLRLVRPYAHLGKKEVLERGRQLRLELTWSCMRPIDQLHCGQCNKCAERKNAFAAAEIHDPTLYAHPTTRLTAQCG
jgi:7-cyano-7-deazaguanine synthase